MNAETLNPILLTLVTFTPLAGALLLMLLPRRDRDIRVFSLGVTLLTFLLSLLLPLHFEAGKAGFQYEINRPWIARPSIDYHLGVDGVSLWLVVLTAFLTPLCVLISWKSIHERVKEFFTRVDSRRLFRFNGKNAAPEWSRVELNVLRDATQGAEFIDEAFPAHGPLIRLALRQCRRRAPRAG